MGSNVNNSLELVIEAMNDEYDPTDNRWIDQVTVLHKDLQNEVGELYREVTPEPGKKGLINTILLRLTTDRAVDPVSNIFKAWLERDRSRNLKITIRKNDITVGEFEISGKGIKSSDISDFKKVVLNKLSEGL